MSLPQLNVPHFRCKLPSTDQEIVFRPFLIGEEKVLLIALEGEDEKQIADAVITLIKQCLIEPDNIDVANLPTFDIEYLFLKLRSKSAGEVIEVSISHPGDTECDHKTKVNINIDDIEVDKRGAAEDSTIMLTDNIGVTMKYPSIKSTMGKPEKASEFDKIMGMICGCIDNVFEMNPAVVHDSFTAKEIEQWALGLSQEQFEKIVRFLEHIPKLSFPITWTCEKCGKEDTLVIEGLRGFFS